MSYKICTEWFEEESIDAICPYCGLSDNYRGGWQEGNIIKCTNEKCNHKFELGKGNE